MTNLESTFRHQLWFAPAGLPATGLAAKLENFGLLPVGWNFGEGIPTPRHVRDLARVIAGFGDAFAIRSDAFPASDGSVAVAFYQDQDCVEVVISPTAGIEMHVEHGVGFDFVEDPVDSVSVYEVLDTLRKLSASTKWTLRESSTLSSSTLLESDPLVSPSSHLPAPDYPHLTGALVSLSSKHSVLAVA